MKTIRVVLIVLRDEEAFSASYNNHDLRTLSTRVLQDRFYIDEPSFRIVLLLTLLEGKNSMQRSSGTFLFFTFLLLLTGTMFASLLVLMPSYPVIGGHARNAFVFEWDLWWLGKANMNQTPFHTPFLFSPRGTSLIPFVLYPLPSLLFQPIVRLFGIHTAYNFLLIFLFLANGGVLYIFFRELFRDQEEMELQAFFATGILLTSGWVYGAFAGAYLHIASFWVPGILGWLLFRWLRQPSWERFFLFVMGWVLAVYTDIQMTLLSFLIL